MEQEKEMAAPASEEAVATPEKEVKTAPATTPEETKKKSGVSTKTVIIVSVIVIVAILIAAGAVVFYLLNRGEDGIGYEGTAQVMLTQDDLQAAMDEAMKNAADGNVALRYQNDAFSDDGIHFECYIANSPANIYDMFLTIYTDIEMTDQVFLSGLVAPGNGFTTLTLEHALESGDHVVYVAVTQVKENENGEQVLHNQVVHTMNFIVS